LSIVVVPVAGTLLLTTFPNPGGWSPSKSVGRFIFAATYFNSAGVGNAAPLSVWGVGGKTKFERLNGGSVGVCSIGDNVVGTSTLLAAGENVGGTGMNVGVTTGATGATGENVGNFVGGDEGGFGVGMGVGLCVGFNEGRPVGFLVGDVVGPGEGCLVGDCVGL